MRTRFGIDSKLAVDYPDLIAKAIRDKFSPDQVWIDKYEQRGGTLSFPVKLNDNRIAHSHLLSSVLMDIPKLAISNVYAKRGIANEVLEWIRIKKDDLLDSTSMKGGMMNRYQRMALLLRLMELLREKGSWCGAMHIQKSAYFAQDLTKVPFGYDYVIYKYGPFSSSLRDELSGMLALLVAELEAHDMF